MDEETKDKPEDEAKPDEEVAQLMEDHDVDEDTAEKIQELIEEGPGEDDVVELADDL